MAERNLHHLTGHDRELSQRPFAPPSALIGCPSIAQWLKVNATSSNVPSWSSASRPLPRAE